MKNSVASLIQPFTVRTPMPNKQKLVQLFNQAFTKIHKVNSFSIIFFYFHLFLTSGGGFPLLNFTVVTLPLLRVFHCELCRIRTRNQV